MMKPMMRVWTGLLCVLLSGCGIGGYWMNGNPAIGRNITPLSDKWEKTGISHDERRSDWVDCGGTSIGSYYVPDDVLPNATYNQRSGEVYYKIQRCMMKKGYLYTATCEGEIPSQFPACIARKNAETE